MNTTIKFIRIIPILAAALGLCGTSSAQSFSIQAGPSVSQHSNATLPILGYNVALIQDFRVADSWSIRSSVSFDKGGGETHTKIILNFDPYTHTEWAKFNHLNARVGMKFHPEATGIRIAMGARLGYLIRATLKFGECPISGCRRIAPGPTVSTGDYERPDFGVWLEYEKRLSTSLYLGCLLDWGIANIKSRWEEVRSRSISVYLKWELKRW